MRPANSCAMNLSMVKPRCSIPCVTQTKMRNKTRTSGFPKAEDYHFAMNRMWLSGGGAGKEHRLTRFGTPTPAPVQVCLHKER